MGDTKKHISSKQAAMCLIKYCPDRREFPLMKMISEGCNDKGFKLLRCASFEYVNFYLFAMIKEFEEKKKKFWEYLEHAIKGGLGDSDPTVRELAYASLLKKDLAEKYIKTLKKARKEKYESIKKEELRRIQSSDSYQVAVNVSKGSKSPKIAKKEKSFDNEERAKAKKIKKEKDDRVKREKAEHDRLEKEKKEKEKAEKLKNEKLKKQKAEKLRLEKQRKEREEKLKADKLKNERLEKERKEKEERDKRMKFEKEKKENEEKERLRQEKEQSEQKEKEMQKVEVSGGDNDDDKGFPNVHQAYKQYAQENSKPCDNPSHLVLYAKKKGINGVPFSKASKYFKAINVKSGIYQ